MVFRPQGMSFSKKHIIIIVEAVSKLQLLKQAQLWEF
jgi:hypothetical protein